MKTIADKPMTKQPKKDFNLYSRLYDFYLAFPTLPKEWQDGLIEAFDNAITQYKEANHQEGIVQWTTIKQKFVARRLAGSERK